MSLEVVVNRPQISYDSNLKNSKEIYATSYRQLKKADGKPRKIPTSSVNLSHLFESEKPSLLLKKEKSVPTETRTYRKKDGFTCRNDQFSLRLQKEESEISDLKKRRPFENPGKRGKIQKVERMRLVKSASFVDGKVKSDRRD